MQHNKENQQAQQLHGGEKKHECALRGPILALRFHGAAPTPRSPVHDCTPDQMFERECEEREKEQQEVAAVNAEKTSDASVLTRVGGVIASAATAVGNVVHAVTTTSERALRDRDHKLGEEKFALNFPELVSAGDRFIVQYDASVMSKGKAETGHILLSDRHLCFVNATIKDALPLDHIVSIQPSIAVKTVHGDLPYFMPIPKHYVLADAIQIFVNDHRVLQFLGFDTLVDKAAAAVATSVPKAAKSRSIDMFYNWLDHQWRKAVRVPVDGVQYTHDVRHEHFAQHESDRRLHALHQQQQQMPQQMPLQQQRRDEFQNLQQLNLQQQQRRDEFQNLQQLNLPQQQRPAQPIGATTTTTTTAHFFFQQQMQPATSGPVAAKTQPQQASSGAHREAQGADAAQKLPQASR